jgi:hypothetical protein
MSGLGVLPIALNKCTIREKVCQELCVLFWEVGDKEQGLSHDWLRLIARVNGI